MAALLGSLSAPAKLAPDSEDSEAGEKLGLLMERLRQKKSQLKSWGETSKLLRIAISDKRQQSTSLEKVQLQKYMETLQKALKVNTIPALLERLETLAVQTGLKYTPSAMGCIIASDLFKVEVLFDGTGIFRDVRVAHCGRDSESCPEIQEILKAGNHAEFLEHLRGFVSMYQIGEKDKKLRIKGFMALTSLESDLNRVAQFQSSISGVSSYIHKSPLGILQPRCGGKPMRLTYFVAPYDLLDGKAKKSLPMTVEAITDNNLGHSAEVCIEPSSGHKLQTMPLMTINKTEGKSLPHFAAQTNLNSVTLPAQFILKLGKPVPVAVDVLMKIQQTTGIQFVNESQAQPLVNLIIEELSGHKTEKTSKDISVKLPGQQHTYVINEGSSENIMGIIVDKIPFTLPTNVPSILQSLRQQLLFNTLISSCVRGKRGEGTSHSLVFEVTPVSLQYITIAFEHPLHTSMATAELDLSDITTVKCKLYTLSGDETICSDDYVCRVIQRCLSIPVTMRAIVRKVSSQIEKLCPLPSTQPASSMNLIARQIMDKRLSYFEATIRNPLLLNELKMNEFSTRENIIGPFTPGLMPNHPIGPQGPVSMYRFPNMMTGGPPHFGNHYDGGGGHGQSGLVTPEIESLEEKRDRINKNPMLASLLDQDTPSPDPQVQQQQHIQQQQQQQNSILSSLLGDQPSTVPNTMSAPPKQRKKRVRRSASTTDGGRSPGSSTGKSPKRKVSEADDFENRLKEMEVEQAAGDPFDSSVGSSISNPALSSSQVYGDQVDPFGVPAESQIDKLKNSVDNFIKKESKLMNSCQGTSELSMLLSDIDTDAQGVGDSVARQPSVTRQLSSGDARPGSAHSLTRSTSGASVEEILSNRTTMLDSDAFQGKDAGTFTPTQFLGEPAGKVNRKYNKGSTESIEFNAELLNPDSSFADSLIENATEEMDLDTCDANAFGVGFNPVAMMASKIAAKSETVDSNTQQSIGATKSPNRKTPVQRSNSRPSQNFDRSNSLEDKPAETLSAPSKSLVMQLKQSEIQSKIDSPQEALDLSTSSKDFVLNDETNVLKNDLGPSPLDLTADIEVASITGSGGEITTTKGTDTVSPLKIPAFAVSQRTGASTKKERTLSNKSSKISKEGKRRNSDRDGGGKRKKDDTGKDKGGKRRKTVSDVEVGRTQGDQIYSIEQSKKPTAIKITTSKMKNVKPSTDGSTGKIDLSKNSGAAKPKVTVIPPMSSKKPDSTGAKGMMSPPILNKTGQPLTPGKMPTTPSPTHKLLSSKISPAQFGKSPPIGRNSPSLKNLSGKASPMSRSPSTSGKSRKTNSQVTVSKQDSKLMNKTPTLKLKPIALPASQPPGSNTTPTSASPGTTAKQPFAPSTPTTPGKIKARKKSLSAVIDNLTKQSNAVVIPPATEASVEKKDEDKKKDDKTGLDVLKPDTTGFLSSYKIPKKVKSEIPTVSTGNSVSQSQEKIPSQDTRTNSETKPVERNTSDSAINRIKSDKVSSAGNTTPKPPNLISSPGRGSLPPGRVGGSSSTSPRAFKPNFGTNNAQYGASNVSSSKNNGDDVVNWTSMGSKTAPVSASTAATRLDFTKPPASPPPSEMLNQKPQKEIPLKCISEKDNGERKTSAPEAPGKTIQSKTLNGLNNGKPSNGAHLKYTVEKRRGLFDSIGYDPKSESNEKSKDLEGRTNSLCPMTSESQDAKHVASSSSANIDSAAGFDGTVDSQKSGSHTKIPPSHIGASHKNNHVVGTENVKSPAANSAIRQQQSSDKDTDNVFKAPTPKPPESPNPAAANTISGDSNKGHAREDGSPASKRSRVESHKPVLSPRSDASSPDNLIIDYPSTPKSSQQTGGIRSPTAKLGSESPAIGAIPQSPAEEAAMHSPAAVALRSPAAQSLPIKSPIPHVPSPSSSSANNKSSTPSRGTSPGETTCDLDDDLMDAALMN